MSYSLGYDIGYRIFKGLAIGIISITAILVIVLIAVAFASTPTFWAINAACAKYGYPEYRAYWYITHTDAYCVKRVNYSDVVIPLSELQGAK